MLVMKSKDKSFRAESQAATNRNHTMCMNRRENHKSKVESYAPLLLVQESESKSIKNSPGSLNVLESNPWLSLAITASVLRFAAATTTLSFRFFVVLSHSALEPSRAQMHFCTIFKKLQQHFRCKEMKSWENSKVYFFPFPL